MDLEVIEQEAMRANLTPVSKPTEPGWTLGMPRTATGWALDSVACNKCGTRWTPEPQADGNLPADWWKCPNGCNAQAAVAD